MNILIYIIILICLAVVFFYLRNKKTADKTPVIEEVKEEIEEGKEEIKEEGKEEIEEGKEEIKEEIKEEVKEEIEEGKEEIKENSDKQVTQNKQLIADLHRVLEEEKVFLRADIHIDDVARMLLTNRTYITRLMRQEYGLTFIEYVNIARIQYSQSLLYSYDMTLDEVSEKSGFQSTSNYCRTFKRYIGMTPLNWLQQVKPEQH